MGQLLTMSRSIRLKSERGQSMTELAIFMPIFLIIMTGIAEMGFYINAYLNVLDATRESARYGADLDPFINYEAIGKLYNTHSPFYGGAPADCDTTTEFYSVLACYTLQNIPYELDPDNNYDDIIISAFTVKNGTVLVRWPDYLDTYGPKTGWSLLGNQDVSQFSNAKINSFMDSASPDQGLLIIEIFYQHEQILALPFLTAFIPKDIGIHVYTVMPNPTAGTFEFP